VAAVAALIPHRMWFTFDDLATGKEYCRPLKGLDLHFYLDNPINSTQGEMHEINNY